MRPAGDDPGGSTRRTAREDTMSVERHLEGRHAIVTGGGRGIGAAIADALARRGATVTITGRDLDVLRGTARKVSTAHGVAVAALACDVTDEGSVSSAFATAQRENGDAYILVNNAGQAEGRPFLETTRDLWDRMLAVNLTGAYLCTQQVLGAMLREGTGRIINIASTSGLKGYRNITAYCASKHGLVGLTRALAAETARAGITVNAVCPAYTDTAMTARAIDNVVRDMDRTEEQAREMIARAVPRGTLIRPDEVAGTVAWLCSPDATGISGQAITIAAGEI
jgi:NAD(P)-dependent dehydrogenase (short-subunit alcohol dehydrogenase family)